MVAVYYIGKKLLLNQRRYTGLDPGFSSKKYPFSTIAVYNRLNFAGKSESIYDDGTRIFL
jgi:hypothetical protein